MKLFGRKPKPVAINYRLVELEESLPQVPDAELIQSLIDELSVWGEGWSDQHVAEWQLGLIELGNRLGATPAAAKEYILNQAELQGVAI